MTDSYADILLPLAKGPFTFRLDPSLHGVVERGTFVRVQLGKRKYYAGVVMEIHGRRPAKGNVKEVDMVISAMPVLPSHMTTFWEWVADYYMCSAGEVMRAAIPAALKPEGFDSQEFLSNLYAPRKVRYLSLHDNIRDQQRLHEVFESLGRAKKQYHALISFAELAGDDLFTAEIPRELIGCDPAVLKALEKKNVLAITEREAATGRPVREHFLLPKLSSAQGNALDEIRKGFRINNVVLLHSITGSGKTEIYSHLISETLGRGKDVLYLVPEIVMSTQLIHRMERVFGDRLITYHSKYTDRQRALNFIGAATAEGGRIMLGTRSAVFVPLRDPELIVVDEEHDPSYKQSETSPRYNARDAAVYLAGMTGSKVLLGSATPSMESYSNALAGKYSLVRLTERYGGARLPQMVVSDTLSAVKRGERRVHFNKALLDRIAQRLDAGEQTILFQNRRGFSPYVECGECGWVAGCPECNVTLTLHKGEGRLVCHYCGHSVQAVRVCPSCGTGSVEGRGFGTEKVEEELLRLFPRARVARLDRDTAASPRRYSRIIEEFGNRQTDILIGTQMVTKGFDFGNVSLVGILNADNLLNYPDFRATERAFQILAQTSGRAGRRDMESQVVIQTSQPASAVIRQVVENDYDALYRSLAAERRDFLYPPFCRLISITLRHTDRLLLSKAANSLGDAARSAFGKHIVGPQPPAVDKVRGEYLLGFLLKVPRNGSFAKARRLLRTIGDGLCADPAFRTVRVIYNVDPQ